MSDKLSSFGFMLKQMDLEDDQFETLVAHGNEMESIIRKLWKS